MQRSSVINETLTASGMLSARSLADAIRSGHVSAKDVFDHVGMVMAAREPFVLAFEAFDLDGAKAAASEALGPLRAIPFAVKDNFDTEFFPTCHGSPIYTASCPMRDAASVDRAKRAGAALVGKTSLAEFAMFEAPKTQNPRYPGRTPGGSSSGSAAAVAAGMVAFTFGSQTAGSIIRPASFCGVVGYKPSYRLLPDEGVKSLAPSLDTVGLFAATVADAVFVVESLTGEPIETSPFTSPPRLALCTQWGQNRPSSEAVALMLRASGLLERAGAVVTPLDLPEIFGQADAAFGTILSYEAARALALENSHHRPRLSARLREFLDAANLVHAEEYARAQQIGRQAEIAISELWRDFDAILTPSAVGPPPLGLTSTGSSEFNRLWTMLRVPTVSVPGLETDQHLPIGLQVIGANGADASLLKVAKFIEMSCNSGAT